MNEDAHGYIPADYVLDVFCEHVNENGGTRLPNLEKPRLVARIIHVAPPRPALGFIEWREALLDDGTDPEALQTYYGEAVRLGTFGSRKPDGRNMAPNELVPGMNGGMRWRFYCPTCKFTKLRTHSRLMETFLERARSADLTAISVTGLLRHTAVR